MSVRDLNDDDDGERRRFRGLCLEEVCTLWMLLFIFCFATRAVDCTGYRVRCSVACVGYTLCIVNALLYSVSYYGVSWVLIKPLAEKCQDVEQQTLEVR